MKRFTRVACGFVAWIAAGDARAEPTDYDRTLAAELFVEARELMAAKSFEAACPKLVESHRLDPGGGVILNAALCHELAGRTATAWTEFQEALAFALRDKRRDREQTAREHLASLEPKLLRIAVVVPKEADVPGLALARDGRPLGRTAWGSPVPVDPGAHRVEASAPGYASWAETVDVSEDAAARVVTVHVPALEALAPEPTPAPAVPVATPVPPPRPVEPAPMPAPSSTKRTVGWITLATGGVALGVGGFFGARAIAKRSASDDACSPICREDSVALNDEARTSADVATVTIGAALLLAGVGTYLVLTSPSGARSARVPGLGYAF